MSELGLSLTAIAIFATTLLALVGPMLGSSPLLPAGLGFGLLVMFSLDSVTWQGRGATLLIDGIQQRSPEYRQRILHHEAGHYLVATALGLPVTGYTLSAWQAFQQGQSGRGGVQFQSADLEAEAAKGQLSQRSLEQWCQVLMAGAAAEQLVYGNVEGGADDRAQWQQLWRQLDRNPAEGSLRSRWGLLKAKTLIDQQRPAYEALVAAMATEASIEDCNRAIAAAWRDDSVLAA
ncbi:ATP-dependent Zn protease [Synechococcus elongatus IITB7]|uniref:ATP-dependent Zn protease n=1 Tax=Synechococcus elongatus TaxID=32046 RepID=UPI0030CAF8C2